MTKKKTKAGAGATTRAGGATTSAGAMSARPPRSAKSEKKGAARKSEPPPPVEPAAPVPAPPPEVAPSAGPEAEQPEVQVGPAVAASLVPIPATRVERSAAKRQAVLQAILPLSTSARMARLAEEAVWAISSDKTHEMISAQEQADRVTEAREEAAAHQAGPAPGTLDPALRRGSRDGYGFFRAELDRGEDDDEDPHSRWRRSNERLRHEVLPGAAPERLAEVEARLGIELPRSYYDFCLEWNGARLFNTEGGCIRVIPATGIVDEIRGPLANRMVRPYLPVVDLGCGDYLALDTERAGKNAEFPLVWWYGGEPKKRVADGFGLWLRHLVDVGGHPYWWDVTEE